MSSIITRFKEMSSSWQSFFLNEASQYPLNEIIQKMDDPMTQKVMLPSKSNIFKAFERTPLEKLKVVILGQDPYPTPGHANGLAFSVNPGVSLPRSLRNIFKELNEDLAIPPPLFGDLTPWAQQGVLLLNTILTVQQGEPGSHKSWNWEVLSDRIIQHISKNTENTVFLLWGGYAQKKAPLIDANKHFIISTAHPSPLSARRGFFGSKPFSKINEYLSSVNKEPISWRLDPS